MVFEHCLNSYFYILIHRFLWKYCSFLQVCQMLFHSLYRYIPSVPFQEELQQAWQLLLK